jgi:hypothetical protein
MGHPISADTVRSELTKLGSSRQHNRKADEGYRQPDTSTVVLLKARSWCFVFVPGAATNVALCIATIPGT